MIISATKILTLTRRNPIVDNGAVVVRGDKIIAVGPIEKIRKLFPAHRVMNLNGTILMPGLVNAHVHLELPPLLDTVRSEGFPDWILSLIRQKKALDSSDYDRACRNNIETIIKTGTTTVGEICTHGVSPVELKKSGLRATIFHELIAMSRDPLRPFCILRMQRGPGYLIQYGISPHSPYTVSEPALQQLKMIAAKKHLPLCMHVAESKDELRLCRQQPSGLHKIYDFAGWDRAWAPVADSPFAYLNKLGMLGPDFLAVHAVQADDNDIALLKKHHVPVAHCPRSNHELDVGRMKLKKLLDAGLAVGLGTDSLASSPSLSLWDEMRFAFRVHRRDGITAEDLLRLATIGGAAAIGLDEKIGSLERGKKADIIAVPLPSRNTGNIYSDLLRETESSIMTMVNGKILWSDNR